MKLVERAQDIVGEISAHPVKHPVFVPIHLNFVMFHLREAKFQGFINGVVWTLGLGTVVLVVAACMAR